MAASSSSPAQAADAPDENLVISGLTFTQNVNYAVASGADLRFDFHQDTMKAADAGMETPATLPKTPTPVVKPAHRRVEIVSQDGEARLKPYGPFQPHPQLARDEVTSAVPLRQVPGSGLAAAKEAALSTRFPPTASWPACREGAGHPQRGRGFTAWGSRGGRVRSGRR
ncbi:hypothetical protein ABT063_51555 [Streptomyces sp. NPDC002838]|uniref:hypothetical protein n=1 Tax=Streptomyces sp. NPDC002838 TaxID=3154436 RepID=UPI003325FB45